MKKLSVERARTRQAGTLEQVIEGGFCIGCGACAALDKGITINFDRHSRLRAHLPINEEHNSAAVNTCPFTGAESDEDALAKKLFNGPKIIEDNRIGRHLACFAGWVEEDDLRAQGSSGGLGTWLQRELLTSGLVDAVLNVAPRARSGNTALFSFTIAHSPEDVVANAKTRYYPVEMSGVIQHILNNPGRYATIGTPCFAKALRLAARQSPILAERLSFVLGIVCGHLKSAAFAESLAWQCGFEPDSISTIDFRAKLKGRPASRYGVEVVGRRGSDGQVGSRIQPMEGLVGENWGHGLFKYRACDFCDDVLAETADAVVGDAWLPKYDADYRGTNVLVVRHPQLLTLVNEARAAKRLHLEDVSADDVAASQAGGLRHRREGLAYRLWLADKENRWRPKKRVVANRRHLTPAMRRIHQMRMAIAELSHAAWREARDKNDFTIFANQMKPLMDRYERCMNPTFLRRLWGLVERKIDILLFRLTKDSDSNSGNGA